jgi:hypothetical protein
MGQTELNLPACQTTFEPTTLYLNSPPPAQPPHTMYEGIPPTRLHVAAQGQLIIRADNKKVRGSTQACSQVMYSCYCSICHSFISQPTIIDY